MERKQRVRMLQRHARAVNRDHIPRFRSCWALFVFRRPGVTLHPPRQKARCDMCIRVLSPWRPLELHGPRHGSLDTKPRGVLAPRASILASARLSHLVTRCMWMRAHPCDIGLGDEEEPKVRASTTVWKAKCCNLGAARQDHVHRNPRFPCTDQRANLCGRVLQEKGIHIGKSCVVRMLEGAVVG